jgi:hypothetical protein
LLGFPLAVQPTGDVHTAARIRQNQGGGAARFEVADLALEHFRRELGVLHGEDPSKPAAVVAGRQFHDLGPSHGGQKGSRLSVDSEVAIQVARR